MDAEGFARFFEQAIPVTNRNKVARIGAVLGDRRSIELTIFAFTVVLQTLHAPIAKLFAGIAAVSIVPASSSLGRAQIKGDLLVQLTADNMNQHLSLARS